MSKKIKPICQHCGASMLEHKHSLSVALVTGLRRIYNSGSVNIKHLGLTRNQWDNFQKLRYWDLVRKSHNDDGKRVGGTWEITQKGKDFVDSKISIPRTVWTYRGSAIRNEGPELFIESVVDGYMKKPDYAKVAKPHVF